MMQLTEEHKSLWRIKDQYLKDADGHEDCSAFWQKMVTDKEEHIAELSELLKKHMAG